MDTAEEAAAAAAATAAQAARAADPNYQASLAQAFARSHSQPLLSFVPMPALAMAAPAAAAAPATDNAVLLAIGQLATAMHAMATHVYSQPAAPPPPPLAAPRASVFRHPKPVHFSGDMHVDNMTVSNWIFAMECYADGINYSSTTDGRELMSFAANLLTGAAQAWWRYLTEKDARPRGWVEFKAALIVRFQPAHFLRDARTELSMLRQTGSVQAYSTKFQRLILTVTNLPEDWLVHMYVLSLKPSIKAELLLRTPTTLLAAISMAESVDGSLVPSRLLTNVAPRPATQRSSGPTPMELGAVAEGQGEEEYYWEEDDEGSVDHLAAVSARGPPSRAPAARTGAVPMTSAERQRRVDGGLCFKCGQAGHASMDCPSRPKGSGPPRAGAARS